MSRITASDRTLPSLLDRLSDEEPNRVTEPVNRGTVTVSELRAQVRRDMEWLLNSVNLESRIDLSAFPDIRASAMNFGLPALGGLFGAQVDGRTLCNEVARTIRRFEPRIIPDSLKVTEITGATSKNQSSANADDRTQPRELRIEADLWHQPLPEPLLLRTRLDLQAARIRVSLGRGVY